MGVFITFEGPEGGGKSTQAQLLYQSLQNQGYPVILTREPGGTRIGELIRRILVDLRHTEIVPGTEIFLFSAARSQLVNERIRPYLDTGGIVICDRYADSTYAYQGYGLGLNLDDLRTITTIATGGLSPDLTLYLDIAAEAGLERKATGRRGRPDENPRHTSTTSSPSASVAVPPEWNRLDARDLAYHQRVAAGFYELMQQEPQRWRRLDATQPIPTLAQEIGSIVQPLLAQVMKV